MGHIKRNKEPNTKFDRISINEVCLWKVDVIRKRLWSFLFFYRSSYASNYGKDSEKEKSLKEKDGITVSVNRSEIFVKGKCIKEESICN